MAVVVNTGFFASPWIVLGVLFVSLFGWIILDSWRAGLSHVPGPFLARYTDLWRFYQACKLLGKPDVLSSQLQERYGDVVRIGPRMVAVFDPNAISTIYGTGTRLNKGDGYYAFSPSRTQGDNILTLYDEDTHAKFKRPMAHAYSLSALKGYEHYIDSSIAKLVDALSRCTDAGEVTNLSRWGHFYAYDTVALVTLGRPLGLLDTGKDVSGMVEIQKMATAYAFTVFHLPWLDMLMKSLMPSKSKGFGAFKRFIASTVNERLANRPSQNTAQAKAEKPDLLAHFIQTQEKYPLEMSDDRILTNCAGSLLAGSQSPSMVLDTVFRFLATTPSAQDRLYEEIARSRSSPSLSPIPYATLQTLPYLDAVIRESYRVHGQGILPLERMTPSPSGLTLPSGTVLPPRVKVAILQAGLMHLKHVYGPDADRFNPDRWLPSPPPPSSSADDFPRRRALMERSDMSFGFGSRMCMGKNLTNLEIYKVVAELVWRFNFEAVETPVIGSVNVIVRRRIPVAGLGSEK